MKRPLLMASVLGATLVLSSLFLSTGALSQLGYLAGVRLQAKTPGTPDIGNANISGTFISDMLQADGLQLGTSSTPGHVLTTDGSGVGTWQPPVPGPQGPPGQQGPQGPPGPQGVPGAGMSNRAYRWNVFSTYMQDTGWVMGNDSTLFGGVNPSNWSDNNATANMISSNRDVQRALFTRRATFGSNALVYCDTWHHYSSTNGKIVVCLFRVRNNTSSPITWTPWIGYTAYSAWNEMASCALNGALVWSSGSSGQTSVSLSIPANGTSTVIFAAGAGSAGAPTRTTLLGFFNNSLVLPEGLEFVDDFDTAP